MTKFNIEAVIENIKHYFKVHNSNLVEISFERKDSGVGVPELNQLFQRAKELNYEMFVKTQLPLRAMNEPVYGMGNEENVVYYLTFRKGDNK
ncbi:MAG: hypothetical protein KJ646_05110 [Nanoarchaeota archaeon]|nr:hypothetical protein [Nanoarchaeota archaeon]MBU4116564.1 hypothetical protein [Nanoarchaeota archaeon]